MKNQSGLSHISMVIIIAILIVVGLFVYKFLLGNNGILREIVSEEEDFSQKEILEGLNKLVAEKYLSVYNSGGNIQTDYNTDVVVSCFEEKGLIAPSNELSTYDENGYKVYLLDVSKLDRDVSKNQIASIESSISPHSTEVYSIRRPIVTNEDGSLGLGKELEVCFKNEKDVLDWKAIGNIAIDNPESNQN